MKNPSRIIGILSLLFLAARLPAVEVVSGSLSGSYLGQKPPGATPEVFARGIVSDEKQQHGAPSFSPDGSEVFWQTNRLDAQQKWQISFLTARCVGDTWTKAAVSPHDGPTFFSPDGQRLYIGGNRNGEDPVVLEKRGDGWSASKPIALVTRWPELQFAYSLSITRNGTLYFLGNAGGLGTRNNFGIYRAEPTHGEYAKPELLPPSINLAPFLNWTPFVAPDESFLLFSSNRQDGTRRGGDGCDLYISHRLADGSWTDPVSLGQPVNTRRLERFPALSPDGKYLFFTRDTPNFDEDVYWVEAASIPALASPRRSQ